jgi:hypothetical protein
MPGPVPLSMRSHLCCLQVGLHDVRASKPSVRYVPLHESSEQPLPVPLAEVRQHTCLPPPQAAFFDAASQHHRPGEYHAGWQVPLSPTNNHSSRLALIRRTQVLLDGPSDDSCLVGCGQYVVLDVPAHRPCPCEPSWPLLAPTRTQ